jgi:hypothetical protein
MIIFEIPKTPQYSETNFKSGRGSGSGGSNPTKSDNLPRDDPNQLVKSGVKSNSQQIHKPQLLRCIHNAIAPGIFSVNEVTLEKFRSCSGPGWNSIQHLKYVFFVGSSH